MSLMLTVCIVASLSHAVSRVFPPLCISGCQPFASSFPLGAHVCFGDGGNERESLQQAKSVQDMSMPYLVVSLKRVSAQIENVQG